MTPLQRAERDLYIEESKLAIIGRERDAVLSKYSQQEAKAQRAKGLVHDLKEREE